MPETKIPIHQISSLGSTFSADQTSEFSISTSTITDVTGCTLSLPAGTYLITANVGARLWASASTSCNFYADIYNSTSSTILVHNGQTVADETRRAVIWTISTIANLSTTSTIKLRGYVNVSSNNFASGFRDDSENINLRCHIMAIRLG